MLLEKLPLNGGHLTGLSLQSPIDRSRDARGLDRGTRYERLCIQNVVDPVTVQVGIALQKLAVVIADTEVQDTIGVGVPYGVGP